MIFRKLFMITITKSGFRNNLTLEIFTDTLTRPYGTVPYGTFIWIAHYMDLFTVHVVQHVQRVQRPLILFRLWELSRTLRYIHKDCGVRVNHFRTVRRRDVGYAVGGYRYPATEY